MRALISATLAAAAGVLASCTSYGQAPADATTAAASGGRQCIWVNNISGYRRGPGDTVVINTNSRDYYEFRTQPYCADRLDWEHRIALRSRAGNFVCSGYDAEIYVPDAVGAVYCPLYDMRKLTPAEVTALRNTKR